MVDLPITPDFLADKVMRLRSEKKEKFTYTDLVNDELSDAEVAQLHLLLDEYQTSLNAVVYAVGREVVRRHEARGGRPIEVDGYLITTEQGTKWEKCIDTFGFLSWLAENPQMVHVILNPNEVKKGSLPPAVRSTFFESGRTIKPHHEPKPSAIPLEMIGRNKT